MAATAPGSPVVVEIPDACCDNVCSICEMGGPDDDGLMLCDGFCLRAFHAECLGDGALDQGATEQQGYWACFDCTHGLQRCFVCKQYERSKRMVKCTHGGGKCGNWFHVACAPCKARRDSGRAVEGVEGGGSSGGQILSAASSTVAYVCPQHVCHACGSIDIKSKCLKCVKSYCQKCRPAAVHVLDDRKYFTCVEHLQGTTLPPIPVRFMEKLVTTRMKSRTRCPSKHAKALEKAQEFEKMLPKGRRGADGGGDATYDDDDDDSEDERLMSMDQLISLREERALEFLRGQKVRMDAKQQQQNDLLKKVSIAVNSSSSSSVSESSSKRSSSSRKRKDEAALDKLKAAMNRQNRPRKRARTGTRANANANLMPSASYVSLFQRTNRQDSAVSMPNRGPSLPAGRPLPSAPSTNAHGQIGASAVDMAPFGSSMESSGADTAPFGSSITAPTAANGSTSSSLKRPFISLSASAPASPQAPRVPQQTVGEIRAGVLKMVASMLEEQRAKVAALRADTCAR